MKDIVFQSAGSFSVAVLCMIITVQQIILFVRKPEITWFGWSAGISFSGMLYAIGVFFEYNTEPGFSKYFFGVLEFNAIILLIHCIYGFTFTYLGIKSKLYHIVFGLFHLVILVLLWTTNYFVADHFVAREFIWLAKPFVEAEVGPLGAAFEFYCITAGIGAIVLWTRSKKDSLKNRRIIIAGMVFWIALSIHDGLASMGMRTVQYLMEYGLLAFSSFVMWLVFSSFEEISTIQKYRTVSEFAYDIIVMVQEGVVVFANPAAASIFCRSDGNPTLDYFFELILPEDRERFNRHYDNLLNASDSPESLIIRIKNPNGNVMIVEIRAKLVSFKSQPAILAFMRDTTQRIREEKGNYDTFFDSMEDMVVVARSDGMIIHTNTATKQKLGYNDHEVDTMHVTDLCLETNRAEFKSQFTDLSNGERKAWHLSLVSKTGTIIPAEIRMWFAVWNGLDCVFGIAKDLTVEQDAKQLLNRLFRNNPALMVLFSMPEQRIIEVNRAFLSTFLYEKNAVIGKTSMELDLFLKPGTAGTLLQTVVSDGHIFNLELQMKRKDGSVFDCLFSAEIIRHRGHRMLLCVMIDISVRKQIERKLRHAHNSLEQRVRERTKAIKEMHEQMLIQEKLASIGQMTAGISHELNNPINFVATNFASLKENFADLSETIRAYKTLLKDLNDEKYQNRREAIRTLEDDLQIDYILEDTPALFEESQRGFDRIDNIIKSMRQFSYVDREGKYTSFDINKAIENTIVITRNAYKYCAEITTDLGAIPNIACFPEQIHQVLLNLIVNSAYAIEQQNKKEKGKIFVRTFYKDAAVVCEVADDGPGIPPEIRNRIFEAFFTTKPPGKGSGLGLSISYDIIVNKHKGGLHVKCPESGGTVFTLRIPDNLER